MSPPDHTAELIGLGLFVLSELIGMSRMRDNSVLELILHMGQELFPYELRRKQPPTRASRPQLMDLLGGNREPRR